MKQLIVRRWTETSQVTSFLQILLSVPLTWGLLVQWVLTKRYHTCCLGMVTILARYLRNAHSAGWNFSLARQRGSATVTYAVHQSGTTKISFTLFWRSNTGYTGADRIATTSFSLLFASAATTSTPRVTSPTLTPLPYPTSWVCRSTGIWRCLMEVSP